jgi:tetratricopeptide (TPR) repeat protein
LGDDLLEKTAAIVRPTHAGNAGGEEDEATNVRLPAPAPEAIPDQLESARILVNEGIVEEAKRVLRRILLAAPNHIEAKRMLDEIHETELKQIFGETGGARRRPGRREPESSIEASADLVLRDLDRDLKLGLGLSLFEDRAAMEAFGERMDREFASSSASDRVDMGIAFLEMDLHDLAARHFSAAVQRLEAEEASDDEDCEPERLLSATGLLAYSLVLGGKAFEATIAMQQLLGDAQIQRESKLDLIYLMGRAYEAMEKPEAADAWYAQTLEIDPRYRDAAERLISIRKAAAARAGKPKKGL